MPEEIITESLPSMPPPKASKSLRKDGKPKGKPGRKPGRKAVSEVREKITAKAVENVEAVSPELEEFNGWKVADGFFRVTLFPLPEDKDKFFPVSFVVGEKMVQIYKGAEAIVPLAIKTAIDSACGNKMPFCDRSNKDYPKIHMDHTPYIPFPHSRFVPASLVEYKEFLEEQKRKPTAKELEETRQRKF